MKCRSALAVLAVAVAGCGASTHSDTPSSGSTTPPRSRPQAIEPAAGSQAVAITPSDPVGCANCHAPPLSVVRREIKLEYVSVQQTTAGYINPLYEVTCCGRWERTDQGVDATMPVGAPIFAPTKIKILAIEPDWYAGQPLVYWELLEGADAGSVQYVAEQITDIAPAGRILQRGQAIARFAATGTGIEFGWSTRSGVTLAVATTGYEEGEITPAGRSMRGWLNALGARAGPNF
jgi:hypothetical protein